MAGLGPETNAMINWTQRHVPPTRPNRRHPLEEFLGADEIHVGIEAPDITVADAPRRRHPYVAVVKWHHEDRIGWHIYCYDPSTPRRPWRFRANAGVASAAWTVEQAKAWAKRWLAPEPIDSSVWIKGTP